MPTLPLPTLAIFATADLPWIGGFCLFVVLMLLLDAKVLHRRAHEVKMREAALWSVFWVALGLGFTAAVYALYQWTYDPAAAAEVHRRLAQGQNVSPGIGTTTGAKAALLYLTGYVVEEALSVDNLFVFLVLFSYFKVEPRYQHRVLFWGILGAIVMRLSFILAGVALIGIFHWLLYGFGGFLVFTGGKLAVRSDESVKPEKNWLLRLARKVLPVTPDYVEGRFFVSRDGRRWVTPLFVVLLVVESTDVAFAADSIPAILGITRDPFIVFSSNVFAILGLRALYFVLAGLMRLFHLLNYGLAAVLVFIGAKMLFETAIHDYPPLCPSWLNPADPIPTGVSLSLIGALLALAVAASLVIKPKARG